MIRSLYDLMGKNVSPFVDESIKIGHVEKVLEVNKNSVI